MGTEVITIGEVAKLLHLHTMTVYRLAKEGKLPGFKVGGRWRFQRDVLEQWMVDRAQVSRMEAENRRLNIKTRAAMNDKAKILLVDDEPDVVQTVGTRLRAAGYQVAVAYDGQQALDEVNRQRPDMILLDVMLPKLDGYKACRLLKFDERYKQIPILIFTERANTEDVRLATECGADAHLNKPFELDILLGMLEKLISTSGKVKPS